MIEDKLTAAMEAISDCLAGIPGVNLITDDPPEQIAPGELPAILIFPGVGNSRLESAATDNNNATRFTNYTINIDIHTNRKNEVLGAGIKISRELIHPVLNSLFKAWTTNKFHNTIPFMGDPTRAGGFPITFQFSNLGWGTVETVGYRIKFDISLEEEIG